MNSLIDIVYPKTCLVCKTKLKKDISCVDDVVCVECWANVKRNLPPFCHRCGRRLKVNNFTKHICPSCIKKPLHFDRAFSVCKYEGVIKELIHKFKYESRDYVGSILSRLMVEFIREYNLPVNFIDVIIPVPLHRIRLREREFNQAEILSNYIASEFNKDVLNNCLLRHRYTKTQTELEENQRLLNVKDSFSVARIEAIKDKNVLLVDDVLTSGATSSEAAYTLKNAGANIVFVLTLAS